MRRTVLLLALATLLLTAGCGQGGNVGNQKGNVAQDFSLTTLEGGAGNLRDYRGHVVVLNFWASWCAPCRAEMPDLQAVYSELRDKGLMVVGVNQGESLEKVTAFSREFGLSFPIMLDESQSIARKYGVRSYPTTFILDGEGVIQEVIVGGPLTRTQVRRRVEGLLK
jgi:peroxiredoxin